MEVQNVKGITLPDGRKYTGWGFYQGKDFVPQGCGKKFFDGYYAYGNFINGFLNGPAIVSHDYYMYTEHFKNNRGNGWGLCINSGSLIEFGYYENSQLKIDLLDFVEWYFNKMENANRSDENMLNMYTFKDSKQVSELLIGFSGKILGDGIASAYMGFRFKSDGSVWVGSTGTRKLSGDLIHFRNDGLIDAGRFEDGELIERKSIHDIIDKYYGIFHFEEGDFLSQIVGKKYSENKSSRQIELERQREEYRFVPEIKVNYNYICGFFIDDDDDLP